MVRELTANRRPTAVCEHRKPDRTSRQRQKCSKRHIETDRSALISPQTVCSLAVSPISMKYLHNCVCTTAARYQHICETTISKEHGLNDDATYSHEWM